MSIRIIQRTSTPRALTLAAKIASYLFEEEYGECSRMKKCEIENLQKVTRMLQRIANRNKL